MLRYATTTLQVHDYQHTEPLLAGLVALVGADAATLTHLNLRTQHEVALSWPPSRLDQAVLPGYPAVAPTHPLRRPLGEIAESRPRSVEPVRISDVLTTRAWRATAIHRDVLRDTSDQMCLPLSFHGPATKVITLSRTAGAFTDRQKDLLSACAPHLRSAIGRAHPGERHAVQLAPSLARVPLTTAPGIAPNGTGLSTREHQVLEMVVQGLTDAQIGRRLGLSPATVSKHLHRIYRRLGLRNHAEATRYWLAQQSTRCTCSRTGDSPVTPRTALGPSRISHGSAMLAT